MNIGQFTKKPNGDYQGSICTFGFLAATVTLEAVKAKGDGPGYIVHTPTGELGAAWTRTSKAGNEYLSVSFRGPLLAKPIFAALVATEDENTFALVWSEPKAKDKEPQA